MPSATLPAELHQIAREAARTGRRPAPPRTATILGLGHYLPSEVVTNGAIAEHLEGVDDQWIVRRTGIHARRRVAPTERTSDIAVFAGRRALQDAGVEAIDLDYVIVATMSPDEITPNCAPLVAHALGAERAAAYDVGAACTGFLAGLTQAAALVEVGRAERILLIGAESLTRLTDFHDKKTGMLFGDGAGAAVIGPSESGAGVGPIDLSADGGLGDTIVATFDDGKIRMDGISTFKIAVKRLSESTVYAVAAAGLELDDIDLFVYHQANARIIKSVGERLDLEPAKVADYISQLGNTSAASVPLTLSLAREDGRLRPGHKVLLAAIGAGFTWGAGVMEWTAQ
jgi:3-oxoacyl-[acyl-carrier-protein] synthase III